MKIFTVLMLSLLIGACAHHRDVRAGDNDIHRVVIQTDDKEQGARDGIAQANHFCKQYKKQAAFVEEEQKYTGDLDEKTYNNAKRATKVAKTVGAGVFVLGGRNESPVGGVVGLGGAAADEALGKGYTVEMKFRCK